MARTFTDLDWLISEYRVDLDTDTDITSGNTTGYFVLADREKYAEVNINTYQALARELDKEI